MNKTIKKKWLAALRSGAYKQGHGALCKEYNGGQRTYCCLGVLCDVMGCTWKTHTSDSFGKTLSNEFGQFGLSSQISSKLGIPDEKESSLINMNDSTGRSFKYIASYIERYL